MDMEQVNDIGNEKNYDLVNEKEEVKTIQKWLALIMLQKKTKEHNPNRPQIPDHPYRILIVGALDLEKQTHYLI